MEEVPPAAAPPMGDDVVVQVRDLKKYFELKTGFLQSLRGKVVYVRAVDGIGVDLHQGEILGRKCKFSDAWQLHVYDGQQGAQSPIRRCADGDVSTVDVRDVARVPRDRGWVYGLTVPATGNFVAGESPFLHRAADGDSA